jgi:(2Fe-2S) ferredoxin
MKGTEYHIFVLRGFHAGGGPLLLRQYLERELANRGMAHVSVSSTESLNLCESGPAMIVYPQNWWYGKVRSEADVEEILDALEQDRPAVPYLLDTAY